nr:nicotinate-nucleotide adenylyltransferase [Pseudothauera nasutitermitis]
MMSTAEPAPLGLLGGTFDPIHFAHLRLAEEAREALDLAGVRLLPAGQPAHRDAPHASANHRLTMARLAAAGNPALEVDDGEVRAAAASYTVPTLERLRAELGPARPLVLILGADAFHGLPGWHRWGELFDLAHVAVANRPGHAPRDMDWVARLPAELAAACSARLTEQPAELASSPSGRVIAFAMTPLDISASHIRALLARGASPRYLLPDSVLDYIGLHHLYRTR